MPAGLQDVVVLLVVAAALAYAGRRLWRSLGAGRRKQGRGCGPDCGCGH